MHVQIPAGRDLEPVAQLVTLNCTLAFVDASIVWILAKALMT